MRKFAWSLELGKIDMKVNTHKRVAININTALNDMPNVANEDILNEVTMDKALEQYIALAN